MNRDRRKALKVVLGQMEELTAKIEEVKEALQEVIDEEEEALGNLPESIQDSERGETMQGTSTPWKRSWRPSTSLTWTICTRRSRKLPSAERRKA